MTNQTYKVIIVDNKTEIRQTLQSRLETHKDMKIVAASNNLASAAIHINDLHPHLVFISMDMNQPSNFLWLDNLRNQINNGFKFVFITEGIENANKALRYGAFDYLTESFLDSELDKILNRFRIRHEDEPNQDTNLAANNYLPPINNLKLLAHKGYYFTHAGNIAVITSGLKHCVITDSRNMPHEIHISLIHLVEGINDPGIVKINKSFAINCRFLQFVPHNQNYCELIINGKIITIPISPAGRKKLNKAYNSYHSSRKCDGF